MAANTEGVGLHFVQSDGGTWAGFLKTKLSERRYGINVRFYYVNKELQKENLHGANILLVSPDFLAVQSYEKYSIFNRDTSLIVLLGVTEEEYKKACTAHNGECLASWPIFETQANESSVRALLVEIIDLYEHAHCLDDDKEEDSDTMSVSSLSPSRTSQFSDQTDIDPEYDKLPPPRPVPKKAVKPEANKVLKILETDHDDVTEVFVLMENRSSDEVDLYVNEEEDTCTQCSFLNTAVYTCKIPKKQKDDKADRTMTVKCGGKEVGKKTRLLSRSISHEPKDRQQDNEDRDSSITLRDSVLSDTDPLVMLCKALRLPDNSSEVLDEALSDRCKKFRPLEALKTFLLLDEISTSYEGSDSTWPTLLHFGAEYNLIKFCEELLHFPSMVKSCAVRNRNGDTPEQMARKAGNNELADVFESNVVQQRVKRNSPGNKDSGIGGSMRIESSKSADGDDDDDDDDDEDDDEDNADNYMPMKDLLVTGSRSDSVLDDKKEEEDDEELNNIPPPTPHKMKPVYNNDLLDKSKTGDDNVSRDVADYQTPPEPRPCPVRTKRVSPRKPVPTPPPDYYGDEAPNDYMQMSEVKKRVPPPTGMGGHALSPGNSRQESFSSQSSFDSEGVKSPEDHEEDHIFTIRGTEHTGRLGSSLPPEQHTFPRSHSESDALHPHELHEFQMPEQIHHTRHLSLSKPGDMHNSSRHSKGLFSKISNKFHIGHRKQSLPEAIIPEEIEKLRKKSKHKADVRISDASTASNSSNDSTGVEKREKHDKKEKHKGKKSKLFGRKKMDVSATLSRIDSIEENRGCYKNVNLMNVKKCDRVLLKILSFPVLFTERMLQECLSNECEEMRPSIVEDPLLPCTVYREDVTRMFI
ncbi:hypothetical protein FSP39_015742 [Pinctada imbricata]|uniref:Uncharacterized protein n=1 Tax=Pinctada imbricata TaxID=66713 RepID=A0AA89BU51_PINIB|nr:hypothetical protein FSP39_015742 [Pinctada imbricata]